MTRKGSFKSGARLPHTGPSRYLSKLDPWFVSLASSFREQTIPRTDDTVSKRRARSSRSMPPAVSGNWPQTVGEMLESLGKHGDSRFAHAIGAMRESIPEKDLQRDLNEILPNSLSLLKYQVTMPALKSRESAGDRNAGRHVVQVMDLYTRWMHDQLPRKGIRVKTNVRHNLLMIFGLAGGVEKLTSQELADFFDLFCSCGETHSSEVLWRLRQKLSKAVEDGRKAMKALSRRTLEIPENA